MEEAKWTGKRERERQTEQNNDKRKWNTFVIINLATNLKSNVCSQSPSRLFIRLDTHTHTPNYYLLGFQHSTNGVPTPQG